MKHGNIKEVKMIVYVDFIRCGIRKSARRTGGSPTHRFCRMWADEPEDYDLHRIAREIGLRYSLFKSGSNIPHYQLNYPQRVNAIELGAIEQTLSEYMVNR